MASTEERLHKLVHDNLDVPASDALDPNLNFAAAGVPSAQVVAFAKLVADEFGITVTPEDFAGFSNVGDLVNHINANAA